MNQPEPSRQNNGRNNPYPILIVAFIISIPGVAALCHRGPAVLFSGGVSRYGTPLADKPRLISEQDVHVFGIGMLLMALAIVAFYFHLRREIRRDEQHPNRRKQGDRRFIKLKRFT